VTWIIGIDCATAEAKIGLARGQLDKSGLEIHDATLCAKERSAVSRVASWLTDRADSALLAVDAPLGWPKALGESLTGHSAGMGIATSADAMFRRATDSFIQRELKKTPLDVGADKIARTAHKALGMLSELREILNAPIPLAWTPTLGQGVSAIEVYPAATLVARGIRSKGYRKTARSAERNEILNALKGLLRIRESVADLSTRADLIDAAVCVLAGCDFLRGGAMKPEDPGLADREGWIWSLPLQTAGASNRPPR
jgi:predicted RNase H-like nuclease